MICALALPPKLRATRSPQMQSLFFAAKRRECKGQVLSIQQLEMGPGRSLASGWEQRKEFLNKQRILSATSRNWLVSFLALDLAGSRKEPLPVIISPSLIRKLRPLARSRFFAVVVLVLSLVLVLVLVLLVVSQKEGQPIRREEREK